MSTKDATWLLLEKYHNTPSAAYLTDCKRLESGEPLAYVIGHIPFLHTIISLDSHPLIPRPETEYWTEFVIKQIHNRKVTEKISILDLCAGSGCIGVAIGNALSNTLIDFSELDYNHLPTIKKNCLKNHIELGRVKLITSNLFESIEPKNQYDHIVSNPPYIDPELNRVEESVATFEPSLALYGGIYGLSLIATIILQSPKYLRTEGTLWLEHEPEQTAAISELASGVFTITTHKDQYGVERFSELVLQ